MQKPTLFHKDRKGNLWSWEISSDDNKVIVVHGLIDGKKHQTEYIAQATNVGRANERNPQQQADFEVEAKWKFQLDRKYSLTSEEAEETVFLPMLAKSYEDRKKDLFSDKAMTKFVGCDVQPKLDGVRCLATKENGKVILTSRQGKEWSLVPHINAELQWMNEGDCLDGELYIHGDGMNFQTITSWCKGKHKLPHPESSKIEYHVYDVPIFDGIQDATWKHRKENLAKIEQSEHVIRVETYACETPEAVGMHHGLFVGQGYEGAILRLREGLYEFGHRSNSLLKVKTFCDEEFEIIGFESGKEGSAEDGCVIWICKSPNGEFRVRPQGTHEERKALFDEAESCRRIRAFLLVCFK